MSNGTTQNCINSYTLIEHTPNTLDVMEQVAVERLQLPAAAYISSLY